MQLSGVEQPQAEDMDQARKGSWTISKSRYSEVKEAHVNARRMTGKQTDSALLNAQCDISYSDSSANVTAVEKCIWRIGTVLSCKLSSWKPTLRTAPGPAFKDLTYQCN